MNRSLAPTLAGRIFLTFAPILALVLVLGSLYGERRVRSFHERGVERRLASVAGLLEGRAAEVIRAPRRSDAAFADSTVRFFVEQGLRVTIVDRDGTVLVDTEARPPLANHKDRAEFRAALATGTGAARRRSATTGNDTFYLVRRIDAAGEPLGFVRVATNFSALKQDLATLRDGLLLGAAAALVLGLIGSAVVARWLARPLVEIEGTATALAHGALDTTLRVRGPVEIRRLAVSLNRMAKELRQRMDAMERSRRETEAIHASMNEGVVAVDPDEHVILMNDAAARLLGLEAPLPAGSELWKVIRFPELEHALRSALAGRGPWHDDAPSPWHPARTLALSATRVEAGIGAVALLADVTDLRKLDKVRIDFVANVSHEMRTPLTAVLGAIETLETGADNEEERTRFLDIARRNAIRMQAIVADLLELSHIEVEGNRMPMERLRLDQPVQSAVSALSGTAEAKGLALTVGGVPADFMVLGNHERLEQVFTNLIANAIKYTPAGGSITVRFGATAEARTVEVADTGIGMPAAALPRIFERFYRVDKSRSREMGGTGLGLAIVKHCVRAHGGKVSVRSEEGAGTSFVVALPAPPPPVAGEAGAAGLLTPAQPSPR